MNGEAVVLAAVGTLGASLVPVQDAMWDERPRWRGLGLAAAVPGEAVGI